MSTPRILLAEDDVDVRKFVKSCCESAGFEVIDTGDGERAIEIYEKQGRFDLVILDLNMPVRSGFEVCRVIKKTEDAPPVWILTGRDGLDDRASAEEEGADEFFQKPLRRRQLIECLDGLGQKDRS